MVIRTTEQYERWIGKLRDRRAKFRIDRYFCRIARGDALTGDFKTVRPGIIEVRFDFGPGYRVYLTQRGGQVLLLLVGGDKSTQAKDIDKAEKLAREWWDRDEDLRV